MQQLGRTAKPSADKSGSLRYSDGYVWNNADLLGKGATAAVYLGRNRTTGETVAVKVFSNTVSHHSTVARHREIELLRTLDHENVIKLFACQSELSSGNDVLVMTYCQGGSLYTMLDQPQYSYGFPEEEFLSVLKHIASGLKYLRSKGVIHRDIKPGNIMRYIQEDGTSMFVLTDFGAARELPEDETFMSIYGTEEYLYGSKAGNHFLFAFEKVWFLRTEGMGFANSLSNLEHPNMFQRAVLRQSGENHFTSSVDLWSLGVTLYHVATGRLPFKPFGGRGNAGMMHKITTEKETGVISGVQNEPNGPIEWSRDLPKTCRLSSCLKKHLVAMFAGLLETNQARMWNFDQFFSSASAIIEAVTVQVFYLHGCEILTLYMDKTECYVNLQERIAMETEVNADRQILLVSEKSLCDVIDVTQPVQQYRPAILKDFIFLIDKSHCGTCVLPQLDIPTFPAFGADWSNASDLSLSKSCASIAHYIEHETRQVLQKQSLLSRSINYLREYVRNKLEPVELLLNPTETVMKVTKKRLETLKMSQEFTKRTIDLIKVIHTTAENGVKLENGQWNYIQNEGTLLDVIAKAETRMGEIRVYMGVLIDRLNVLRTDSIESCLGCQADEKCVGSVEHLRQTIVTIMNTFVKHKRYGDLHTHEVFIHEAERQRLQHTCVKVISLLQGHCYSNLTQVFTAVQKQADLLLKHYTRALKVETNMSCVISCQDEINTRIDKVDEGFRKTCSSFGAVLENLTKSSNGRSVQPELSALSVQRTHVTGASSTPAVRDHSRPREEKKNMMLLLTEEMKALQTETAQLDSMMKSNVESIKRFLQDSSTLSASSFNRETTEAPS